MSTLQVQPFHVDCETDATEGDRKKDQLWLGPKVAIIAELQLLLWEAIQILVLRRFDVIRSPDW
jgi:hypothetical protein